MLKLKRYILSLLPVVALASCSDYDDPADRFTEVPVQEVLERNVLLIEFTGQNCVNCPTAHEHIEDYEKLFGDKFISVSIHGDGTMMGIISGPMALGTQQGVDYNKHFGIESWPSAVVNWTSGNLRSNYGKWVTELLDGMMQTTDLDMSATATVTPENRISVEVKINSAKDQNPDNRLLIWLSEDNITKIQSMPDGSINLKYVHNNVFRAAISDDLYGDPVDIQANEEQVMTRSVELNPTWIPKNMHAVAFVYNESQGVVNVVKVPVANSAE